MGATIVYTRKEIELKQIKSDVAIGDAEYQFLCELAEKWNVSVYSIAWLGGKPYPMQAALFKMFDDKREKEKLIVAGWETKPIQRATQQELRAGYECVIKLFDKGCFDEATKKIAKEQMNVDMVEKLRGTYTYIFREEGWASIQTVRMPAMQNVDFLNHMGCTRSIDRTLRLIVRCAYTAASELPDGTPDGSVTVNNNGTAVPSATPTQDVVTLSRPKQKTDFPPQDPPKQEPEGSVRVAASLGTPLASEVKQPEISQPVAVPVEKKSESISDKQIALLMGRWSEYVKRRVSGLKGPEIEAKLDRLVKALWDIDKKSLVPAQVQELLGYMDRAEIEVVMDEEPSEKK